MSKPFISYYEHLAKLSQVANKQTMFLSHLLWEMDFDTDTKQYLADMSSHKKIKIMKEVSPDIEEKNLLKLANQYLNKLKKLGIISPSGRRGLWLVNPTCYGQRYVVSKQLREDNLKIYSATIFTKDGIKESNSTVSNSE